MLKTSNRKSLSTSTSKRSTTKSKFSTPSSTTSHPRSHKRSITIRSNASNNNGSPTLSTPPATFNFVPKMTLSTSTPTSSTTTSSTTTTNATSQQSSSPQTSPTLTSIQSTQTTTSIPSTSLSSTFSTTTASTSTISPQFVLNQQPQHHRHHHHNHQPSQSSFQNSSIFKPTNRLFDRRIDPDGLPSYRKSASGTQAYVLDPSIYREQGLPETTTNTTEITHYTEYKELASLVTDGNRANVYHWLSDRDNRSKVNLDVRDPYGSTLLAQATRRHFYAIVLTLLPFCDPNYPTAQGPTIFHSLSLADLLITRALLDFGADPNSRNDRGQTPLMLASCIDNVSFIQYLLFKGADINSTDQQGRTALMYAAKKCSPHIAKYLLGCGASVESTDKNGLTAADYATQRQDKDGEYIASRIRNIHKMPVEFKRILPDRSLIDVDMETYKQTMVFPKPLDLKQMAKEYQQLVSTHGINNIEVDPNGRFIRPIENQPTAIDSNDSSIPLPNNNNNTNKKRGVHRTRTVFEDILERTDFAGRPTEHLDQRYLQWYDQCRAIHIQDKTSQGNNNTNTNTTTGNEQVETTQLKDEKQ